MMGAMILIDPVTNATVGASMLLRAIGAKATVERLPLVLVAGLGALAEKVRAALEGEATVVETDGLDDEAILALLKERR